MKQRRTKRHAADVIETETVLPSSPSSTVFLSTFRAFLPPPLFSLFLLFPPPSIAIELHSPESRRLDHPHLDGQAASAGHEALAQRAGTAGVLEDRVVAGSRHLVLAVARQQGGVPGGTGRLRVRRLRRPVTLALELLLAVSKTDYVREIKGNST